MSLGKSQLKSIAIASVVVTALGAPVGIVGYRISKWFRAMSNHAEDKGISAEEMYVLLKPATLNSGGHHHHRGESEPISLPAGTQVAAVHNDENGKPRTMKREDGREAMLVRYRSGDPHPRGYYGWIALDELQKKPQS